MKITRLLLCGILLGGALGSAENHGDKSLAARVQRLEDEDEIRMLLVNYGRSLDARDFAKYASLFAKDGEWSGGFGTANAGAEAELHLSFIDEFRHRCARGHGHGVVAVVVCRDGQGH